MPEPTTPAELAAEFRRVAAVVHGELATVPVALLSKAAKYLDRVGRPVLRSVPDEQS